ncbi:hypothetical protein CL3_03660 [butyrate-producing bacterium SM4/1]|nr:hypothetical protein CL3_03660 [butyrate-producing bacterium SM4/1]
MQDSLEEEYGRNKRRVRRAGTKNQDTNQNYREKTGGQECTISRSL